MIAVFVDVNNLKTNLHTVHKGKFDYREFVRRLEEKYGKEHILKMEAYINKYTANSKSFVRMLKSLGFCVRYNDEGTLNFHVEMAISAISAAKRCDTVILVTSNPVFTPLMHHLNQEGVKCVVVSAKVGKAIRESAYEVIDIAQDLVQKQEVELATDDMIEVDAQ